MALGRVSYCLDVRFDSETVSAIRESEQRFRTTASSPIALGDGGKCTGAGAVQRSAIGSRNATFTYRVWIQFLTREVPAITDAARFGGWG